MANKKSLEIREIHYWQPTCKPGFVEDDHLSSYTIADLVKRVSTSERTTLYADLLAADRVYLLHMSPYDAVGSYPTLFTLTSLLQSSFHQIAQHSRGGTVSVALSLGLPPVAVSDCRILCCPDFPLALTQAVA